MRNNRDQKGEKKRDRGKKVRIRKRKKGIKENKQIKKGGLGTWLRGEGGAVSQMAAEG